MDMCILEHTEGYYDQGRYQVLQINSSSSLLRGLYIHSSGAEYGIHMNDTSSEVSYNLIDGLTYGIYGGINPTVTYNTLWNNVYGIYIPSGNGGTYEFNEFYQNNYGIYIPDSASPSIIYNWIGTTAAYGLYYAGSSVINAANNYWGDPSGPYDPSDDRASGGLFNPYGAGNRVSDNVYYYPWAGMSGPPSAVPKGPYSGTEGQTVVLDATGSTGTLYEWDIDNDGTYDYSSSSPLQTHIYAQQDTYTIKLRVTLGISDEATTTVDISDSLPTADFTASPLSGTSPLTVSFTSNSTGYDQPLSYEWDFDNDGTVDSTVLNPSYDYTAGTYTVKLKVEDSDGSTNTLIRTNYITSCLSQVRINGTPPEYYPTLQEAFDSTVEGSTIQVQAGSFSENIDMNSDISVSLQGGYGCDYNTVTGITVINGNMTISNGELTIDYGTIKVQY